MKAIKLGLGLFFALSANVGFAQNFPTHPLRLIVANGAGSAPDVIARLLGVKLGENLGQQVIVDNRPGATGMSATELLAKSAPDGYTMFLSTMTQLISMLMFQKNLIASDFTSVSLVGTTPFALVVSSTLPVKNIAEWIAYAKARPGKLLYGSGGTWGSSHLCIESFNEMTGITMTHVPYANTVATLTDLVGGSIHMYCPAAPSLPAFAHSGKLRSLGVTYQKPTVLLPGVPPISDTVPGYELLGWYGINMPPHTPQKIIDLVSKEVAKALKTPELQEKMLIAGADAVGSTPKEFQVFLQKDTDRWLKVLQNSGAMNKKP